MMRFVPCRWLPFLLLVAAQAGPAAGRQPEPTFDRVLEAFRAGAYVDAARDFDAVADRDPADPRATAARVMAAKALYRAGLFRDAVSALEAFIGRHPSSRYAADARRTLGLALDAVAASARTPVEMGVVLSLSGGEALQTQALFNGIRMAVDAHNATAQRPVRMVFREIGADPSSAGAAVRTLAAEGIRVVVGALFSDQARAAAEAAQGAGVVFMAPLATDESVSAGRTLAFQANPTFDVRGRAMAYMAVSGLLLGTLGTISDDEPLGSSRRMAAAFAEEAAALEAEVPVAILLDSPDDWYRLDAVLRADTLRGIRGLYLPITGEHPDRIAGAVLSSLGRLGLDVRVLGNAAWHDLPIAAQATRYSVTYTNDYLPDPSRGETAAFDAAYRAFAGVRPDRLVHAGYDVTSFLLEATAAPGLDAEATDLADAIRHFPAWEGVAHRIHFEGGQVNRALFYHRYRDGKVELFR
jgi:ABC-type branched-subunit amino acid transport system substrate-binding protein